jgi:hypothetical protein
MSLDQIVKLIVDDSGTVSPYLRAIRLFEFQVAIFNPNSFRKLVSAERNDRAPSQLLRTARIFAAIKFLEDIEAELRKGNADKAVSIKQLAENPDYQAIFDEVIAPNGGWSRIRHSVSAKRFDKKRSLPNAIKLKQSQRLLISPVVSTKLLSRPIIGEA